MVADQPMRVTAGNAAQKSSTIDVFPIPKLYISMRHSLGDFMLVRLLNTCSYNIIHYVAIEGKVLQMELRYIHNVCEITQLQKSKSYAQKACSWSLSLLLIRNSGGMKGLRSVICWKL